MPAATNRAFVVKDPRAALGLLACVGILAVCLDSSRTLFALTVVCTLPLALARPSARALGQGAIAMFAIIWSTVLSQGLFYNDQPRVAMVQLGPLTLWREGAVHGLVQSLRFCAVSLAGIALTNATPPERLHTALVALRVPFGLAFLVVTGLRFVPDAIAEWGAVRRARHRRGRPAWRRWPWAWFVLETSMLGPVLARSLRRARALAESLDARGFDAAAPRAVRSPLQMRLWEKTVLVAALLLTAAVVAARVSFVLYVTETWYHPDLRPLYVFVRGWL